MRVVFNPKFLFGILISAALIWYLAVSTEWSVVLDEFQKIHWQAAFVGVLVLLFHQSLRAFRWRYFLPRAYPTRFPVLWDALSIGNLATHIFPLRAGEFIRPYVLTHQKVAPFGVAFASIVIERLFDLVAVLLTFAFVFPDYENAAVSIATKSLTVVACVILGTLLVAAFYDVPLRKFLTWCTGHMPKALSGFVERLGHELLDGAVVLRDPMRIFTLLVLTAAVWSSAYLHFYVWQFLFDVTPSFEAAVITTLCIALAVALPSAPGFVGVFQVACVLGLHEICKFPQPMAVAFSLTMHAASYITFFVTGGISLTRTRFSLRKSSPSLSDPSLSSSSSGFSDVVETRT